MRTLVDLEDMDGTPGDRLVVLVTIGNDRRVRYVPVGRPAEPCAGGGAEIRRVLVCDLVRRHPSGRWWVEIHDEPWMAMAVSASDRASPRTPRSPRCPDR